VNVRVEPDGPVPCDLAVVGESPGAQEVEEGRGFVGRSGRILWKHEDGDLGLIEAIVGRPRSTVYVSNVCKTPLPEADWKRMTMDQREHHERELLAELEKVQPRLVLAFGTRAASVLVPGFRSITDDHGKPVLGPGGKYVSMALWHPAAYLRGNSLVLGMIAMDLAKVEALLTDGLVELMRPPAPKVSEWIGSIGFLRFDGTRKTGKCILCGEKEIAAYVGEGLTWKLCRVHAKRSAEWAEQNLPALSEHRGLAVLASAEARLERVAAKMQAELQAHAARRTA
jgi:uracil-DNA glycosylase family 4